ncbi:DUF2231 domain-containing protein [Massilia sp. BSC265]|uniref:DUF2231 domain-containing protein n=1 Tax=Massilia sp. BSC265 TaxID=1549812 RepID=UPI0004E8713D|nr:DUF2231 domain-containing protein [Massilia sp. BSC265]KFI06469.1 membrane protein [Massilia sp. BSC265]
MSSQATVSASYRSPPGLLHTILLAGSVPLFLGALLSDIAYYNTYQIQWNNFASWLLAGAELLSGLALLFALMNLLRAKRKAGRPMTYFLVLLATWVVGLLNSFEHAKDAWASMPTGMVLSIVVTVLSLAAAWLGLGPQAGPRHGGAQ